MIWAQRFQADGAAGDGGDAGKWPGPALQFPPRPFSQVQSGVAGLLGGEARDDWGAGAEGGVEGEATVMRI